MNSSANWRLTGELRAIDGVLPAALAAKQAGRKMIVPSGNGAEAGLARSRAYLYRPYLMEVVHHLRGDIACRKPPSQVDFIDAPMPDMADVRGQQSARRAMEIAAAGGHHILLIGSPGCGKTLLASRLPGILPMASDEEAIESAAIASVSGRGLDLTRFRQRPFRSPHHTSSAVALAGGGTQPRPGEISLAHNGVLFLDELRRVGSQKPGSAAPAAGVRHGKHFARLQHRRIPGPLPIGGGDESLSVRLVRR